MTATLGKARLAQQHRQFLQQKCHSFADRPKLFTPFLGEFGHFLMYYVRLVHFSQAKEKLVAIRPGDEVFFPTATGFIHNWIDPIDEDYKRSGTLRLPHRWPKLEADYPNHKIIDGGNLTFDEEWDFPIYPEKRIPIKPLTIRNLKADVVLGCRERRGVAPERNWQHWQEVADELKRSGISYATIGKWGTSRALTGSLYHSGDCSDSCGAVELCQGAKLFCGTDSGTAHLAALCGCPMFVFRLKLAGRDFTGRMAATNPGNVEVNYDCWGDPQYVVDKIKDKLKAK